MYSKDDEMSVAIEKRLGFVIAALTVCTAIGVQPPVWLNVASLGGAEGDSEAAADAKFLGVCSSCSLVVDDRPRHGMVVGPVEKGE